MRLETGAATLALSVSARLDDAGEPTGQGFGLVTWHDPGADLRLVSIGIDRYAPVGDLEGVREIDGLAMVNDAGPYPFVLRVEVLGGDDVGSGAVSLAVGGAARETGEAGISYAAAGNLVAGEIVGTWTIPAPPSEAV